MSLDKSVWAEEKVKIFPYDVIEESMIGIKYAKPLVCFCLHCSFYPDRFMEYACQVFHPSR
jgi:hypothetical protein